MRRPVINNVKNATLSPYAILIRAAALSAVLALLSVVSIGQIVTANLPGGSRPAVNPVTNKIYFLSSNNLVVVDGATNTTATVPVGSNPVSVVVNRSRTKSTSRTEPTVP